MCCYFTARRDQICHEYKSVYVEVKELYINQMVGQSIRINAFHFLKFHFRSNLDGK